MTTAFILLIAFVLLIAIAVAIFIAEKADTFSGILVFLAEMGVAAYFLGIF